MKNIEALVTDLETSKQLQEIECETAFVWLIYATNKIITEVVPREHAVLSKLYNKEIIPAFTAGELMQVLPKRIGEGKDTAFLEINFNNKNEMQCGYLQYAPNGAIEDCLSGDMCFDKLPHQALAKLCLWCRKEGYL